MNNQEQDGQGKTLDDMFADMNKEIVSISPLDAPSSILEYFKTNKDIETFQNKGDECILDITEQTSPIPYTLEVNGFKCAPKDGIVVVTGLSGRGKTTFLTMVESAYLGDKTRNIKCLIEKPKVLVADTEQEKYFCQMNVQRLARMANYNLETLKNSKTFFYLRLRETANVEEIRKALCYHIYKVKPDVLVIDGALDLVVNFNNNEECDLLIRALMQIADFYHICIWLVLHKNPNDFKMAGHLGSTVERKATDVFECSKKRHTSPTVFEVRQQKHRGQDIPPMCFMLKDVGNGLSLPFTINSAGKEIENQKEIDPETILRAVFGSRPEGLKVCALRKAIKEECKKGGQIVEDIIKYGLGNDIIKPNGKTYYLVDKAATQLVISREIQPQENTGKSSQEELQESDDDLPWPKANPEEEVPF